jgi:hypothetical protein
MSCPAGEVNGLNIENREKLAQAANAQDIGARHNVSSS